MVDWREVADASDVEEALLALHIEEYGRRPFANMKDGPRMPPPQAPDYLSRKLGV